jgi:hypothetical protein
MQVSVASTILAELDGIVIWWTRQQTLPSTKKKIGGITFILTFV